MIRTRLAGGLVLLSLIPAGADAQWNVAERPVRSWPVEMRDKAEHSLYVKHDCDAALAQAEAGYRHRVRQHDARLVLVKARAHACLGQMADAVLAYREYDQLTDADREIPNTEFAGACSALVPAEWLTAGPETRSALGDSLRAVRRTMSGELANERIPERNYVFVSRTNAAATPIVTSGDLNYSPYQGTPFERGTWYLQRLQNPPSVALQTAVVLGPARSSPAVASTERELRAIEAALSCLAPAE